METDPQICVLWDPGNTSKWTECFLTNRTQTIVLESETSNVAYVWSGVRQSSLLGPCLVLFYINDLPDTLGSNVRIFTYDTIVYLSVLSMINTVTFRKT